MHCMTWRRTLPGRSLECRHAMVVRSERQIRESAFTARTGPRVCVCGGGGGLTSACLSVMTPITLSPSAGRYLRMSTRTAPPAIEKTRGVIWHVPRHAAVPCEACRLLPQVQAHAARACMEHQPPHDVCAGQGAHMQRAQEGAGMHASPLLPPFQVQLPVPCLLQRACAPAGDMLHACRQPRRQPHCPCFR